MVKNEKQQSNPYSTGGGGVIFEIRVQSYFTTLMLLGDFAPCIPNYPITKIKLQGRYDGYNTDDLVIFATDPNTGKEAKLLAQVKHEISITERDVTFSSVIQSAWNDFKDISFNYETDAIALITGPLSATDINEVRPVLEWARTSQDEDDFFKKINTEGFVSKSKKEKLEVFKKQLKDANNKTELSNQELWRFLKVFHIIGFDLDVESGLTLSQIISRINDRSNELPRNVWARIKDTIENYNQTAGTITLESLPTDIINSIEKPIKQLSISEEDISRLVQEVRSRLHDNIESLYGTIPLWNIDSLVSLGDLFVDVYVLNQLSSTSQSALEDLWKKYSQEIQIYPNKRSFDHTSLGRERERISGLEILSKKSNLMVVGKPGSGKTTFLQYVVTECNRDNLQVDRISDLIKLREFVEDGRKFVYSLERYFENRWNLSSQEITRIFREGKALLLLDGLDEVIGEDATNIIKEIRSFARSYTQVQIIVTSRTQSVTGDMYWKSSGFIFVEIADFNERQVRSFSEHWFKAIIGDESKGIEKSQEFLSQLFLNTNQPIRDLVITPVLLSLTCAVFKDKGKLYSKRSELYQEGLDLLLEEWDKSWELKRGKILPAKQKLELLSYLAMKKFEQQQYVLFEQKEIECYIAEFLRVDQQDVQVIMKSIETQHGLLVERAKGLYSFSHLTFQEYLTAKYFTGSISQEKDYKSLAIHISENHWREVILLVSEMIESTENAEILVDLIKQEADSMVSCNNHIIHFLQNIRNIVDSVSFTAPKAAIRSFYLALKMNFDFELCLSFEADLMKVLLFEKLSENLTNFIKNIKNSPLNSLGIDNFLHNLLAYIDTNNPSNEDGEKLLVDLDNLGEMYISMKKIIEMYIDNEGIIEIEKNLKIAKIAINIKMLISLHEQKGLFRELAEVLEIIRYLVLADFQNENKKIYSIGLCSNIARKITSNPRLSLVVDLLIINLREIILDLEPERDLSTLNPDIIEELTKIKNRLPVNEFNIKEFEDWWEIEGAVWTEDLKRAIGEDSYNNVFSETDITHDLREQIRQYYQANTVLKLFLNNCNKVSDSKRKQIEDALLMP